MLKEQRKQAYQAGYSLGQEHAQKFVPGHDDEAWIKARDDARNEYIFSLWGWFEEGYDDGAEAHNDR